MFWSTVNKYLLIQRAIVRYAPSDRTYAVRRTLNHNPQAKVVLQSCLPPSTSSWRRSDEKCQVFAPDS